MAIKETRTSGRKVTVRDVAMLAQVSEATVSRVFNDYDGINPEHRQAVLSAAEQLGYLHRKRVAQTALSNIAFCVRKLEDEAVQNPYFSQILHGAQLECRQRQVSLQLLTVEDSPQIVQDIRRVRRQGAVDGLLLVNVLKPELVELVVGLGLPAVLIEDYFGWLPVDGITSDAFNGVSVGMNHLLRLGHRQIAFIDGPHEHYQARMRYLAYRQSLYEAGIEYDAAYVAQGELLTEGGARAMQEILDRGKPFTAVMCSNDASAFGAMRTLQEAGLRIPQDVSVMGHDDVHSASLVTPPLTTIRAEMIDIGRLAVSRLFERVASPDMPPVLLMTQESLVERASVRQL